MYVQSPLPSPTGTDYLDGIPDLAILIANTTHMGVSPLSHSIPKLTGQYPDPLGSHLAIVRSATTIKSKAEADKQDKTAS